MKYASSTHIPNKNKWFLTPNKLYPITDVKAYSHKATIIVDDQGATISININNSSHLDYKAWTITED